MVTPEPELDICGEHGKSLFHRPFFYVFEGQKNLQTKIDSYFEKCESTNDHRAIALIGALIIEEELDKFLSSWLIGYKDLEDKSVMTFSFKVDLAKSSKLIPNRILNSIEPIRKIRNIFAHDIEIDSFEIAKKYKKEPFDQLYDKFKTFTEFNEKDDLNAFKYLVIFITLSLIVYTEHVTKIMEYIWIPDNLNNIMKS
jgi:hypothetical protein